MRIINQYPRFCQVLSKFTQFFIGKNFVQINSLWNFGKYIYEKFLKENEKVHKKRR